MTPRMSLITLTLTRPRLDTCGLDRLSAAWRGFEDAAGASAFQRWTWVGCLAAERYPDPVLVQAAVDGVLVGLALFNRRNGRTWLHESGSPALDAVFIEHNGPLLRPGPASGRVLDAILQAARGRWGQMVLSGVGDGVAEAASRAGAAVDRQTRRAPFVDLTAIASGRDYLDTLSRNTRHQLRRSTRAYGAVRLDRAATVADALGYLDGLIALHTASWRARGQPGAFASQAVQRFHQELVRRGTLSGEVGLLRVTARGGVVGYLYNLHGAGRVCAYQSGFDYAAAPPHGKPGLLCHHLAIEAARASGAGSYDFLGGGDRYKDSLANAHTTLHWMRLVPRWHPIALAERFRRK